MYDQITASVFVERLKKGEPCCVLDVRTLPEYRDVCLASSTLHVPLDQLSAERVQKIVKNQGNPLYILCRRGVRAQKAAEKLHQAGIENLVVVEGGLDACIALGAEVVRGQGISLERQVRIVAGLIVLSGVLAGALVNPAFYGLAGFVGAGLVFAGITEWCGMAMLLAKAPWNR